MMCSFTPIRQHFLSPGPEFAPSPPTRRPGGA
jgi:hypothetical protein